MAPLYENYATAESRDGSGAADHDTPYALGHLPRAAAPFPFSTHEFARLLRVREGLQVDHPMAARETRSSCE